jgi:hypothetical protein
VDVNFNSACPHLGRIYIALTHTGCDETSPRACVIACIAIQSQMAIPHVCMPVHLDPVKVVHRAQSVLRLPRNGVPPGCRKLQASVSAYRVLATRSTTCQFTYTHTLTQAAVYNILVWAASFRRTIHNKAYSASPTVVFLLVYANEFQWGLSG